MASTAVGGYRPRRLPGRRHLPRAAVVVVLGATKDSDDISVLLVRRAERAGDPWSGDISLPGGRQALMDADNLACALRETHEETALGLVPRDCVGRLSDRITRTHRLWWPMAVSAYVCRLPAGHSVSATDPEIAETLWLPLRILAAPRARLRWRLGPIDVPMPCCDYRGQRVWGLTLQILDELASALAYDASKAGRSLKPGRSRV